MTKDQERKRKLEQEHIDKGVQKRTKTSKSDRQSRTKAAPTPTSDRTGSPTVAVPRREAEKNSILDPRTAASSEDGDALADDKYGSNTDSVKNSGDLDRKSARRGEVSKLANGEQEDASVDVRMVDGTQLQSGWTLSSSTAGRFLNHDPIFVTGGDGNSYLVAATQQQVQILSLASSLAISTFESPENRNVACFACSSTAAHTIDIALDNGSRVQWNWLTSEQQKGAFPGEESVKALKTSPNNVGQTNTWYITGTTLKSSIICGREEMFTTSVPLHTLCVAGASDFVVAISDSALVMGARQSSSKDGSRYIWVEVLTQDILTSVDARIVSAQAKSKSKNRPQPDCAVAIANSRGQIYLLSSVASIFASPHTASLNQARVLHWHRESLPAVKFSKDGNYLISGGSETVLVLWQLETGNQSYLPHLTSEIERIVVSQDGAQYALQMGDNSIMVLSTSELKPVANFPGLQHPASIHSASNEPQLFIPRPAAVLHPLDARQILLSVPATQPKSHRGVTSRPFLQTFDLRNSRHISRQALTRNNVTDLNLGPERTPIIPPDVSQIALSADGQWLAAVDEWFPPASDLRHTIAKFHNLDAPEIAELEEQQGKRREVYLKFWHWDTEQSLWTLTTRVDAPHARFIGAEPGDGAGQVLKLISDPSSNGFASIGSDGTVKIWRPKAKSRRAVPAEQGGAHFEWTCKHSTALPLSPGLADEGQAVTEMRSVNYDKIFEVEEACLAFSPDGSLLACAYGGDIGDIVDDVHFLSPVSGLMVTSKAGLSSSGTVLDLGFIDRYFITLTQEGIRVWNLIDDAFHYALALPSSDDWDDSLLAIDHENETFAAITFGDEADATGSRSGNKKHSIEILSPRKPDSLFKAVLNKKPVAVLTGKGSSGFVILFEDNTVRTLTPPARQRMLLDGMGSDQSLMPVYEESGSAAMLNALKEASEHDDVEMEDAGLINGLSNDVNLEDDRPVVRPEQLAAIFDVGQSFAMPPIKDMFQSVVGLYARKPFTDAGQSSAMEINAPA